MDWPDDVSALAGFLGITRFAVVGFSGGGPYALACAYKTPERLTACGVISGVGRMGRFITFLASWMPWLMLPIMKRSLKDVETARKLLVKAEKQWPAPDRDVLKSGEITELMASSLVEALRPGTRGAAYDGMVIGREFGFSLEDITFPNVFLWHGEQDNQIPVQVGRDNAGRIKTCKAKFYPDEGHMSVIVNYLDEILNNLTEVEPHSVVNQRV